MCAFFPRYSDQIWGGILHYTRWAFKFVMTKTIMFRRKYYLVSGILNEIEDYIKLAYVAAEPYLGIFWSLFFDKIQGWMVFTCFIVLWLMVALLEWRERSAIPFAPLEWICTRIKKRVLHFIDQMRINGYHTQKEVGDNFSMPKSLPKFPNRRRRYAEIVTDMPISLLKPLPKMRKSMPKSLPKSRNAEISKSMLKCRNRWPELLFDVPNIFLDMIPILGQ